MYNRIPLDLNDFLMNLQTFDLVIMRGMLTTSIEAQAITNSTWSHVGMVVVAGDLGVPNIPADARLFWEANTADTASDILSNSYKAGPQLVLLEDRIVHNYWVKYDSAYMARKLFHKEDSSMIPKLKSIIDVAKNGTLPYSGKDQTAELTNFMMGRFYNMPSAPDQYSCSQLVATTYMALGLMAKNYVSNGYAPSDFTEEVDVSLLKGAFFGREIMLDTASIPPVDPNYKPYTPN